tara:strand:- start:786 stop:1073 length:288 start_codon:yes stop_codon:yes gene_type:complete
VVIQVIVTFSPLITLRVQKSMHVEGVGELDEYGSYIATFWTKGVAYFIRDMYLSDIERHVARGEYALARPLIARLEALNSDIRVWEQNGGRVEGD